MTDERIIAYLLEELPEEDLEQFEEECFAQENWPTQINLVEEDLIDAYLRYELSQEQRQRFERNYLTTEARQERVMMAAAFLRHVDEFRDAKETVAVALPKSTWTERFRALGGSQTWVLRAVAALSVVAIITITLWLYLSREPSPQTFATLTLTISAGNTRAEGAQAGKVNLPLSASALRISLMLPEGLPPSVRYRVELVNDNGETKPLEVAGQDAQTVTVVIPAVQLARGPYALRLFMTEADGTEQRVQGSYFFTVE